MHRACSFSDVFLIFLVIFVQNDRTVLLFINLRVDNILKLSLIAMGQVVMIDHAAKLLIILEHSLVVSQLKPIADRLQRFHVEIVLQTEVNVYFTSSHHQLLQLQIFEVFVKNQVCAEFGYVELKVFFWEDCGFTLIGDDSHKLIVDLAVFS